MTAGVTTTRPLSPAEVAAAALRYCGATSWLSHHLPAGLTSRRMGEKPMGLSGQQLKQIQDALLAAYDNASLRQLVGTTST